MKNKGRENVFSQQQKNAERCFIFFVMINSIITFGMIGGILISVNGYIKGIFNTYSSVTCCGSICLNCLFSINTLCMVFSFTCVFVFFAGIGSALYKAFLLFTINRKMFRSFKMSSFVNYPNGKEMLKKFPYKSYPLYVSRERLLHAFTFGIFRPKICVSSDMFSYLTRKELQAVILHEAHHLKDRAPLRCAIMQIFCALNFFLPLNNYLVSLYKTYSEKAADDAALQFLNEPLEMASALIKLSRYNTKNIMQIAVTPFSGEQQIWEDRIRRLIEPEISSSPGYRLFVIPRYLIFLSLFFVSIIFLSVFSKTYVLNDKDGCKENSCHVVVCK